MESRLRSTGVRCAHFKTESLILWRRVAGGLNVGQQQQLASTFLATLRGTSRQSLAAHELSEIWRLVGSLELLNVQLKIDLGEAALKLVDNPKYEKSEPAILWALGRIGARQMVYGPLNAALPTDIVESWLDKLVRGLDASPDRQWATVQLARKTDDRYRDVRESTRQEVIDWLHQTHAPGHYSQLVQQRSALDADEEANIFGEALPLGIRLSRS